jgi:hypothetical protein
MRANAVRRYTPDKDLTHHHNAPRQRYQESQFSVNPESLKRSMKALAGIKDEGDSYTPKPSKKE